MVCDAVLCYLWVPKCQLIATKFGFKLDLGWGLGFGQGLELGLCLGLGLGLDLGLGFVLGLGVGLGLGLGLGVGLGLQLGLGLGFGFSEILAFVFLETGFCPLSAIMQYHNRTFIPAILKTLLNFPA